jgi:hypothetical protein
VTHVPDDSITGGLEDIVEGDGELDHAEAPGKVPADLSTHPNQLPSELRRDLLEVFSGQGPKFRRRSDVLEQIHDFPIR